MPSHAPFTGYDFFWVSETVYAKISSDKEVERFRLYFPAAAGSGFPAAARNRRAPMPHRRL